ncbi:MAG: nucleotide exchange factor GrpE [Lachnospiraceae bacterium]|nr:nucleotide exchange factor GrpE [Lachnospiraceae bacterium]
MEEEKSLENEEILEGEVIEEEQDTPAEEPAEQEAEAPAEEAEEEVSGDDDVKKGILKKKKKDKKDEKIEELNDQLVRRIAEFENFRRRTEKEKTQMFEVGAKSVIEKLLPIVDSFERGFDCLSDEQKAEPFADGMDKVYKQLTKMLEEAGVVPIEAAGKEFDPNFHNAVMQVPADEEHEAGIVAQELMKGYMYRDSVVRHSMVSVYS